MTSIPPYRLCGTITMILLSYNKTFITDSEECRQVVEEAIQDLFQLLENWTTKYHTYEKCSIQMATTAILALQCMNSRKSAAFITTILRIF